MPAGAVRDAAGTDVREVRTEARPLIPDPMALEAAARLNERSTPRDVAGRHFRLRRLSDRASPASSTHELHAVSIRLRLAMPPEDTTSATYVKRRLLPT